MQSEITEVDAAVSEVEAEPAEDKRRNRSIRFSDAEWEEVRRAALVHDTPPAEFVRETVLELARNPGSAVVGQSLAPLVERIFRYTWFLATERRDAMLREGRKDEIDALVTEARALHDRLRVGASI